MKFLLPLLRNNILQLSHANQLRYADTKNRTKTITLYMLIAAILMGLLAYLIYSLKIIYSIAWSLEEVVTELVIPMVLICVSLNIAISVFWGSGLLLSDTNIDSMLALPIPLRTLILSKLTVLFMVEVALTVALLLPMMVLFGLTADMGFPFYLIVLGITIIFPVIPGLLGTMIGTQIYRILKSSSARIARLKAAAAILVLFAFMIFMFCKFPDIAAGNFGDVISTSTFTLYADQYIHRLLNGDYLLIGLYFGGVFLIGVILLYGLIKIFRNWYSNDAIQGSKSQPVDWNKQTTEQHSPVSALLERERTRYFSLPVYLTNTACGLLDTLNAFDYDGVAEIYNNPAVDASTFEASGEIIETYGTFESYGNVSYVADKTDDGIEFVRVIQIANYEKGKLTFTASFFEDGSVAGFRLAD